VVRGRRLNLSRRRLIAQLRARGWTLARIANQLGITRQAVHYALTTTSRRGTAICCHCQKQFDAPEGTKKVNNIYCLNCMSSLTDVPIGRRVESLRIILGLTQSELADRTGIHAWTVHHAERGKYQRRKRHDELLLAFLEKALAKTKRRAKGTGRG
jgi:DNA-binding XRE family transcriptional regulator